MVLLLDNYDSFTYNLADYIKQCGVEVEVIRNDELDFNTISDYSGIVISPGPGSPEASGATLPLLERTKDIPVLGVCLGMQAIAQKSGGTISKADYPMHGKVSELVFDKSHPMFKDIELPLNVCRYHSLIVQEEGLKDVKIIARSQQKEAMALAHNKLPLWGVQFHPEAILTIQGMKIIQNWLNYFNIK